MNEYIDEQKDYNLLSMTELQDTIDKLYDQLPTDKRTKGYQLAKSNLNNIIIFYNKKAQQKIYNKIK